MREHPEPPAIALMRPRSGRRRPGGQLQMAASGKSGWRWKADTPLQMDRFKMALFGLQKMSPGQAMGYGAGIWD